MPNKKKLTCDVIKYDINLNLFQILKEGLLKNLTEIEEYKKLIDHMELTNKMISTIKLIQEFDINLKGSA